jgi:hypothetical protein
MSAGLAGCAADHGREAVYAAEDAAFGGTSRADRRPLSDLQARARTLVDGDWWRRADGPSVVVLAARRSARSSSARGAERNAVIRLAPGQLDEVTLAHELAHALAGVGHGHDERFCAAHIDVVTALAGSAVAGMLAEAYAAFDLPVGARPWPPPFRAAGDRFLIVP